MNLWGHVEIKRVVTYIHTQERDANTVEGSMSSPWDAAFRTMRSVSTTSVEDPLKKITTRRVTVPTTVSRSTVGVAVSFGTFNRYMRRPYTP
jgi:hypothetical protein